MTLAQPLVVPITDHLYELVETYAVGVHIDGQPIEIVVPAGYRTDLATIPRVLWTLTGLDPDGLYRAAAVVHDYLYGRRLYPRKVCDLIFRELIHAAGESAWKEAALYRSVRAFGWMYY